MIERVLIKDYLSFKDVQLEFKSGLIAFTGPSGAGKSLFINALLTLFGIKDAEAKMIEASVNLPLGKLEDFGISEEDTNVLKFLKEKKARYFINSQALSKKNMNEVCSSSIRYLSLRDDNEFSSQSMINLLDNLIKNEDKNYAKSLQNYKSSYENFLHVSQKLQQIINEEKKIDELREFAKYEIGIIDEINPTIGEDEKLTNIRKSLSKKEKINEAISEANQIFEYEHAVSTMLNLCEIDSGFFDECMNDLKAHLEDESSKLEQLDDMDIEKLLDRIEKISKLKSRFGDIKDVLEYREKKQEELKRYENISFEKTTLQKEYHKLQDEVLNLSKLISKKRKNTLDKLLKMINSYLKKLYLSSASILMEKCELNHQGEDLLHVKLNNIDLKRISSGELNRIRLAFIATKNEIESGGKKGILILDEVDANLSGKEAMSVANVLKEISSSYQVLAISHQPQLSSCANCHFLVDKKDGVSTIKLLNQKDRINELARMISGEKINPEALNFATKLIKGT